MSERFKTLLQREWIQHHRGWLVVTTLPPLIALVLLLMPFSTVDVGPMPALGVFLFATVAVTTVVVGIAGAAAVFLAPGVARRDYQDRSIEFWLSLPTGHGASIAATLLMHLLFVPLLALAIGAIASQVIALVVVARVFGASSWAHLPWNSLFMADLAGLARAALGIVLATFWVSPIVLALMAASAWLQRWGVAVLALTVSVGHGLLRWLYGITIIDDVLQGLVKNAGRALIHHVDNRSGPVDDAEVLSWIVGIPNWLFHDGLAAIGDLFRPLAIVALAISAGCFALLVLRRRRSG
ncbi:MAG: hypothetical protein JSR59_01170 [Proteobacteria bacterium]|nr:hypothetical protein [Pseudomonadota bacterium]